MGSETRIEAIQSSIRKWSSLANGQPFDFVNRRYLNDCPLCDYFDEECADGCPLEECDDKALDEIDNLIDGIDPLHCSVHYWRWRAVSEHGGCNSPKARLHASRVLKLLQDALAGEANKESE